MVGWFQDRLRRCDKPDVLVSVNSCVVAMTNDSREAFEDRIGLPPFGLGIGKEMFSRDMNGDYLNPQMRVMWWIWESALTTIPEAPKQDGPDDGDGPWAIGWPKRSGLIDKTMTLLSHPWGVQDVDEARRLLRSFVETEEAK